MAAEPAAAGGPMAVESRAAPDRQAGPVRSDAGQPASVCRSRADALRPLRAASPCRTGPQRRRPSHRLWPAAAPAAAAAPARPSGRALGLEGRRLPDGSAPLHRHRRRRLARLHRGRLAHGLQGRGFSGGAASRRACGAGRGAAAGGDKVTTSGLRIGSTGRRPARCARADPQRRAPSRSHRSGR